MSRHLCAAMKPAASYPHYKFSCASTLSFTAAPVLVHFWSQKIDARTNAHSHIHAHARITLGQPGCIIFTNSLKATLDSWRETLNTFDLWSTYCTSEPTLFSLGCNIQQKLKDSYAQIQYNKCKTITSCSKIHYKSSLTIDIKLLTDFVSLICAKFRLKLLSYSQEIKGQVCSNSKTSKECYNVLWEMY